MKLKFFNRTTVFSLAVLLILGASVGWVASAPHPLLPSDVPAHSADLANGKLLYTIGGCISCHQAGPDVRGTIVDLPAGGKALVTPIGTLYPPNITPDLETGIGKWTDADFINAMQRGLSPAGDHLIPAFPYTSYAHMTVGDVMDLKAYLGTLPAVKNVVPEHDVVALPIVRRGLGLWKWIGFDDAAWQYDKAHSAAWNRGSYLVQGPGHCSECHTPRTLFMSSDVSRLFQGGPHPEGKGTVPSLRDLMGRGRYKDVADLVLAFKSGEMLGYDKMSSGGMGEVRKHIAAMPEEDIMAIAEFITSLKQAMK